MQIIFRPNGHRPDYLAFHDGVTFEFKEPGPYNVPDDLAESLLKKRPEFFFVAPSGGNVKGVDAPELTRIEKAPKGRK